jgi:membrane protease YdiL (CAAX protease family)
LDPASPRLPSEPAVPLTHTSPAMPRRVAPWWHTVVFLVVLLGFAALTAQSQQSMVQRHGRLPAYLLTLGWEWLLLAYIVWGLRWERLRLRELVGGRWNTPEDALLDLGIAVGFWIAAAVILVGVSYVLGLAEPGRVEEAKRQLGPLLPRTNLETVVWLALSATAGFCEEIMFRGYLQTQFTALLRNVWAGALAQGLVFGVAHAYQGGRRILLIAVYGLLFGALAIWRKSLRPGMIGHTLQDSFSGIVFRFLR